MRRVSLGYDDDRFVRALHALYRGREGAPVLVGLRAQPHGDRRSPTRRAALPTPGHDEPAVGERRGAAAPAASAMPGCAEDERARVKTGRATAARSVATTGAAISAATSTPRQVPASHVARRSRTTSPATAAEGQDGIPAHRTGEARAEALEVERAAPSGASSRSAAIQASSTRATTVPASRATPACPQVGPVASCDERRAVGREHRRGERMCEREQRGDKGVRNPPPAAAPLEREEEQERCEDDSEEPERDGTRLARGLDHRRVAARAIPATSPRARPSSIVPRTTSNPAASATAIAEGARMLRSSGTEWSSRASAAAVALPALDRRERSWRARSPSEPSAAANDAASAVVSDRSRA